MNKECYNDLIIKVIDFLINEKEELCNDIIDVATYIDDREKDTDLTRFDIDVINGTREKIDAIYSLITDLEKLEKEDDE